MDYSWEAIALFVAAIVAFGHLNWRVTVLERELKQRPTAPKPADREDSYAER